MLCIPKILCRRTSKNLKDYRCSPHHLEELINKKKMKYYLCHLTRKKEFYQNVSYFHRFIYYDSVV